MFRILSLVVFSCGLSGFVAAQSTQNQPRLIVGIVVDQMRNDFLFRFENLYGDGGFNRLRREGFYAANHRFSYVPTYTAPGHASVYTGTTPSVHGIVANDWYDPQHRQYIYCVQDLGVRSLGVDDNSGQMSPENLKTTTITDELKLFWNDRAKVVGVSIKDRGAVLPAGHLADGAYWLSNDLDFISSSWYFDELPDWVRDFNRNDAAETYLSRTWRRLLSDADYVASLPDDNPYEYVAPAEQAPVLPKDLSKIAESGGAFNTLATSPFGTSLTFDFAKAAVRGENMGADHIPDFLSVSLSSPDFLGHAYGPRAVEVQDAYLRLDRDLAAFLDFLDREVGLDHCLIFLTADHGGAEPAMFSVDRGLPGGLFDRKQAVEAVKNALTDAYPDGADLVEEVTGNQMFLRNDVLDKHNLDRLEVARFIADTLTRMEGIYGGYAVKDVLRGGSASFPMESIRRGLYPSLAPDVVWVLDSGWIRYGKIGTTHGSPHQYDTHVPLLFWGQNVNPGTIYRETHIRDIAPTLSMMFNIPLPSGSTGSPIHEAITQ